MKYVYDIYLNFNETLYDFFDWEKNDSIVHVKRIPVFRINGEKFKEIMTHNIKTNSLFLDSIYNKTEVWNYNKKYISSLLIFDGNNILALMFNKNGISIKRSFMAIDEEQEVIEELNELDEYNLEFECTNKVKYLCKTRNQIKEEEFIKKELKNINIDKLKYIYFECFDKKENNEELILKEISKMKKPSIAYKNLYNILKLTSTSKNKML